MKVLVTSAYSDPEPVSTFRDLMRRDRFRVHVKVGDPEEADAILFVENSHYQDDPFFRAVRRHPWVRAHREKCFMYNEHDRPYCVLPGVYCSAPAGAFDPRRQRACGYVRLLNPCIEGAAARLVPDLLFSFVGRRNARVRGAILELRHPDGMVEDTSTFDAFASAADPGPAHRRYAEVLARSRFVLCPRGVGTSSIRLFETLQAGRVPVILSDAWVPPRGPAWDEFSLRVPEREVAGLPALLQAEEGRWSEMARRAREAWEEWFAPEVVFHRTVESCAELLRVRRLPEAVAARIPQRMYLEYRLRALVRPAVERLRRSGWA
jgi:hypothetical protein